MLIESRIKKSRKQLYHLKVDDQYVASEDITVKKINSATLLETHADVETTAYSMPGFLMLSEHTSFSRVDSIDLSVSGDHFLIIFFCAGTCSLIEPNTVKATEYYPGILQRSCATSAQVSFGYNADTVGHRIIMVLSPNYAHQLLKNETWPIDDGFFSKTTSLITGCGPEHYLIDTTIKGILNDLAGDTNYGLHQRNFVELKLRELFFMLHVQYELSSIDQNLSQDIYIKLIKTKAFLLANFIEPPTIRQLSRIVALNEFKLKKHFKEFFGITIHSFIINLRMEEAERLIFNNYPVNEMALRTGYRSVSHFIATFKSYYGQTPMQAIKAQQILVRKAV